MNARKILFIFLSFLMTSSLLAQTEMSISLKQARDYAIEHNRSMINSDYAVDKSRLALKEAIANGLPQLNASADYTNALGAKISIRFMEGAPPTEIDIKPQSNFYLNLNQLIFNGNYIVGIQLAKLSQEMSLLNKEKTENEVISNVTDAYHMVLLSEKLLEILNQNVDNLRSLYEKTVPAARVGVIEQTNLDQLFVQVNSLQNMQSSAERQAELAKNLLRLQLGADINTQLVLTDSLEQLLNDAAIENLMMKNFDLSGNIDFRMVEQQEALTSKMIDLKRASYLPTLAGFYRYTYKLIKPDFDMSPANMVGLQLNIPLFSSGLRAAQTKQARIDLLTVKNNKQQVADQLRTHEKQLRFNLSNALENHENQKESIEVSRRVYANLKLKYEQGLLSGLDLINADNNYLKAESDYINSTMQVLSARLQLEKLYGTIQ